MSSVAPSQAVITPTTARRFLPYCAAIYFFALGIRLVHLWQFRASPFSQFLLGDAESYDAWAQRIAAGDWLGDKVFYQAPLYPYFLGLLYSILGHDPFRVRIIQAILSSASCVVLAAAGARLFSRRTGLVAGIILALYAPSIFMDSMIQKSALDLFFICVVLLLFGLAQSHTPPTQTPQSQASPDQQPPASPKPIVLLLGIALGALALTRENSILLILPILFWLFFEFPRSSPTHPPTPLAHRLLPVAVLLLGLAVPLLPVATRNWVVGHEFHLTTSQFGPNFYIGNNPNSAGGYSPLRFGRAHASFEQTDAAELAEEAVGHKLTPGEVSSYWTHRALDYIRTEPATWLRLMARKVALLGNATELFDTEDQYTHADFSPLLRWLGYIGHFGILIPLAFIGVILSWPDRRRLWPVYLMTLFYGASVVFFYVFARYRYPLTPFLILFAAEGLVRFEAFATYAQPAKKVTLLTATLLISLFCNWPMIPRDLMRATTYANLGVKQAAAQQYDAAIASYERALALRPDHAEAHNHLGIVLGTQRKFDQAIHHFEEAVRLEPDFQEAKNNLGMTLRMKSEAGTPQ